MSPSRSGFSALVEETDRPVLFCRAQVHVPKRRPEAGVPRKLLNGERWRVPHCQVRTERVPQDVQRSFGGKPCPLLSRAEPCPERLLRERLSGSAVHSPPPPG